jgi:hypothetical protein
MTQLKDDSLKALFSQQRNLSLVQRCISVISGTPARLQNLTRILLHEVRKILYDNNETDY